MSRQECWEKKTSVFGGLQSLGLQVSRCDSLQVEAPEAPEAPKAPEVPKVETVHEKAKKAWMIFTGLKQPRNDVTLDVEQGYQAKNWLMGMSAICLFVYLPIYRSIDLSIWLSSYLAIYLAIYIIYIIYIAIFKAIYIAI